ncbi:ABC transporter substrate-binding protein [Microbacterium sp. NPDC091313]
MSAVLILAGCSSSGGTSATPQSGGTFTIAVASDIRNYDTSNCVPTVYCAVAYDTLTHLSPADGSIQPGLATKWEWADDAHTRFRLTLRDGATFSDGTPVDAAAVVASFTSFLTAPGPFAATSYPLTGAEAGPDGTVDILFAEPVTDYFAAYNLSGQSSVGWIISPSASADRSVMENATAGGGPYTLDSANSVKGVQYTFVPNPDYYEKDSVKYDKVVIKVVADPAARLNAVRSGEVNWASNIASTDLETAESAGLTVSRGRVGSFAALALQARSSGPLADERVRQALSYATNRDDIATALYGDATPTSSFIPEGAEGYDASLTDAYGYDQDKARSLLAEAGYADGLTITVFDPSFFDPGGALGQALKAAYAEVGVTLNLETFDGSAGDVAVRSGQYDAFILTSGGNGVTQAIYTMLRPNGGLANPQNVPLDDDLVAKLHTAATAPSADQEKLAQDVTARLDELMYVVPIAAISSLQAVSADVKNVPDQFWSIEANPFSPVPDEAWEG